MSTIQLEQERIERAANEAADRRIREHQQKLDAELAAERAERQRIEDQKAADAKLEEARQRNHRKRINREAADAFATLPIMREMGGAESDWCSRMSEALVKAIIEGKIPHVAINY